MRHLLTAPLLLLLAVTPASAEEPTFDDLFKKLEELSDSTRSFLDHWIEDLGPHLERLGPALEDLAKTIDDWTLYEPPEVLENGDIIIRRKKSAPPLEPPADDGSIDL